MILVTGVERLKKGPLYNNRTGNVIHAEKTVQNNEWGEKEIGLLWVFAVILMQGIFPFSGQAQTEEESSH